MRQKGVTVRNCPICRGNKEDDQSTDHSKSSSSSSAKSKKMGLPQTEQSEEDTLSVNSQFGGCQLGIGLVIVNTLSHLRECVLLDSESTVHAFCNRRFVSEITQTNDDMSLMTSGGTITTNKTCTVTNIPQTVWHHPKYITNILSLGLLKSLYRITYDSDKGGVFIVHRPGDTPLVFGHTKAGLHLMHIPPKSKLSLIQTVSDNLLRYSKRQVSDAKRARELQATVGFPSVNDLTKMIGMGLLKNNPVTISDLKNAEDIYGPSVSAPKGKTTRAVPNRVRTDIVSVPDGMLDKHRDITLAFDVMYINRLTFLVTISQHLMFTTIEHINSR